MAAAFTVQATSNSLRLDATRGGSASFTVTNRTGRAVKARVMVVPQSPEAEAWLRVAGAAERDLPVDGSDQVVVDVAVPEDVPPATHAFLLRAVAVSAPDEEWGDSQLVSFQTPEPPPKPIVEEPPGYRETLLGALAGGAVVALLVVIVGVVGLAVGGRGQASQPPPGADVSEIDERIVDQPITDICSRVQCTDEELDRCQIVACRISELDRCSGELLACQIAICERIACPTAPPATPTPTPPAGEAGFPIGLALLGIAELLLPPAGAALVLARRKFARVERTALAVAALMLVVGLPVFLGILAVTNAARAGVAGLIVAGIVAAFGAVILPALGGRAFARFRTVGHL